MRRPRAFYRGESRPVWILTVAMSVLVALILLAVWLFYHLQQYMVYDKDGARLVLPSEREASLSETTGGESGTSSSVELIDVDIVIDRTDWSAMPTTYGIGLQTIHARYVRPDYISRATLDAWAADMVGYDALVLDLKPESGVLSYLSSVPMADGYEVNGEAEIRDGVAALKAQDVYLIAQISALVDDTMALRNAPAAMRDALTASVYVSDGTMWLDPYSEATRNYLLLLMREFADMGFDEVLFAGMSLPVDETLRHGAQLTAQPDPADAVASLAFWLREQADALDLRISAIASPADASQDLEVFFKAFDRVAFEKEADRAALEDALGQANDIRIIPITATAPETGSYILK